MKSIKKIRKFIKTEKALVGFIIRLVLFLALYTFIFANHHILTGQMYGYTYRIAQPYFIYLVYPFLVLFFILRMEKIKKFGAYKTKWIQSLGFLVLSISFFSMSVKDLLIEFVKFPPDFIYFSTMLPGFVALFYAIFGYKFIKRFSDDFFIIIYCFALYLTGEVLIGKLWPYMSGIILNALSYILPLFSEVVYIDSSQLSVMVNNFHVNVGAPCSGIYSLVTFTFLFFVSIIFLKQRVDINYLKAGIAFVLGLVAVYILNILRVTTIILVGAFYSPEIAIQLFHEYMSAILLISLFVVYLYFVFPRIIKKKS